MRTLLHCKRVTIVFVPNIWGLSIAVVKRYNAIDSFYYYIAFQLLCFDIRFAVKKVK